MQSSNLHSQEPHMHMWHIKRALQPSLRTAAHIYCALNFLHSSRAEAIVFNKRIPKKIPEVISQSTFQSFLKKRTETVHTAFVIISHYCIIIWNDGDEIWLEEMDWYIHNWRWGLLSQFTLLLYFPSFPELSKSYSYLSRITTAQLW